MNEFELDSRLLEDSTFVIKLRVSQVQLNHDSRFPWFILIPEIKGLKELHEIPEEQQTIVQHENEFLLGSTPETDLCRQNECGGTWQSSAAVAHSRDSQKTR